MLGACGTWNTHGAIMWRSMIDDDDVLNNRSGSAPYLNRIDACSHIVYPRVHSVCLATETERAIVRRGVSAGILGLLCCHTCRFWISKMTG